MQSGIPDPTEQSAMQKSVQQAYVRLEAALRTLADIPNSEIAKARALFHVRDLPRGSLLVRAGEMPQTIAFVCEGILRLYYLDANGREYTKSFCVEHELVAAYSALLLGKPSRLFIEALEDVRLLVTDYRDYQALSTQHPCWQQVNRRQVELLFIKKELRESTLLLDDAETRYRQFLAEHPGLEARVKQHYIASYLGITPVSLSRIRANMRRLNLG